MKETDSLPIVPAPPAGSCCDPEFSGWRLPRLPAALAGLAALALLAALLAGLTPARLIEEAGRNISFAAGVSWNLLPYFLISVAASAWATVSGFSERIQGVFARREAAAVAGAAAVGALIPICSCGVIPLIAALLAGGVPLGPVMAFWISSPLMSPEKFVLTAGALGSEYAVARLVTAVLLGAGAGYMTSLLSARGLLRNQLRGIAQSAAACCAPAEEAAGACGTPAETAPGKTFWGEARITALFLGKWLLLAFFLEGLIVHYVDPAWIAGLLGGDKPLAIPLATAVGIPLYTSGVGAIPIAQGLIASGMAPGPALAFLVAGPVTTVPAMVAVWALVQRRTFSIYLGTSIAGSLAAGYIFQALMG
ncbi:MAG: permease [bacterium]